MQQQIQPYLFFEGRTEDALDFYRESLGAETVFLMRYRESPEGTAKLPDGSTPPGDKVMHAAFRIGDSLVMASDGMCSGKPSFQGFSLSYPAKDEADAKRRFDALARGGKVAMPTDRFGVGWMVIAGAKQ